MGEIDITPVKLAGLTVISAELPNIASRADREATESERPAGVMAGQVAGSAKSGHPRKQEVGSALLDQEEHFHLGVTRVSQLSANSPLKRL